MYNFFLFPLLSHTTRSGKQCRERWSEYLNPDIDVSAFTSLEDDLILRAQNDLGNKWKVKHVFAEILAFSDDIH